MSGLVVPWSDGATAAPPDEDLAARIGSMSIRELKSFLSERRVTPDATIIEKAELRALAYASAGVTPPEPPLPPGWARYESDGRAYYHRAATGETTWAFPEGDAAAPPAEDAAETVTETAAETAAGTAAKTAAETAAAATDDAAAAAAATDWAALGVKELKLVLKANGLSTTGFAEKAEFVALAKANESWIQPHLAYAPPATHAPAPAPNGDRAVASAATPLGPAFDEDKARRARQQGLVERPAGSAGIASCGWQIDVFGVKRGRCKEDPSCIRYTPRNMRSNSCGMGNAAVFLPGSSPRPELADARPLRRSRASGAEN